MKIALGSDHAGFLLKEELKKKLLLMPAVQLKDFGCFSQEPVDYPDYGIPVAQAVARKEFDFGILVCATGVGISIAANKVPGIRAALCGNSFVARMSRLHNDANIIALGSRVTGAGLAIDCVETFLTTPFSGEERHAKRVRLIGEIERRYKTGS